MQNLSQQSPFVDVTDALYGTQSLHATRLKRIKRTDNKHGVVSYNLNLKRYIEFGNMLSLIRVSEQSKVME